MNAPLTVCEDRGTKGVYARADAAPAIYPISPAAATRTNPELPEVECRTALATLQTCVERVIRALG